MMDNFIPRLANVVYTEENIERANQYLIERKINPTNLQYPFTITGSDLAPFGQFRDSHRILIFTDSLYMPITDLENPSKLVGFDVRYMGTNPIRTRFIKFKESPQTNLIWYSKPVSEIGINEPLIVTESIFDALSIKAVVDFPILSFLNAMSHQRFCYFLYAITNNINTMYDNDDAGRKATQRITKMVSSSPEIAKCFKPILYNGKDPNQVLVDRGSAYLEEVIKANVRAPMIFKT